LSICYENDTCLQAGGFIVTVSLPYHGKSNPPFVKGLHLNMRHALFNNPRNMPYSATARRV